ncbi:MAG: CoA transferase [Porticoccaceae bacterium]|nr:CoA transferase [Porticoccaceae bacterium]
MEAQKTSSGPLEGLRIIELQGIGPGPFCAMMLADMGAEVIRIDRTGAAGGMPRAEKYDLLARGRRSMRLDLKSPEGKAILLDMVEKSDGLIEGFRPGVMERLGIGPEVLLEKNPAIVVGRMTGWGQEGPISNISGHDINYIALTGALFNMGVKGGPPAPPLNLVGDFGGGGLLLAFGMVTAILKAKMSGTGQVVDAAMVDGASILSTSFFGQLAEGKLREGRGEHPLNGASHYYDAYECADGEYISIASVEPQFYAELKELLNLNEEDFGEQMNPKRWADQKTKIKTVFLSKTQDEWCELLQQSDICFAPVLRFAEAPEHPHNKARNAFLDIEGVVQPAPAPRFSATPGGISRPPAQRGEHTDEILAEWNYSAEQIAELHSKGAIKGTD